ncbi:GNAT family N-acetyltransferase [Rufibacter latericius]|uniref:N-acetyltransferase n=1 Tax=Rufibacter latericius TaxID=2487040 RepID=A0A3M9N1K1_9BACT|nr:GNAT family N-acetyltransferase [Rufibacter latericius]RNI31662.1 N-acetyltransferase [Rufibacter latericius]
MKTILETERLRLREFTLQDADFIITLMNSPGWLQFIGDRNVKTPEQAKFYLQNGPMKSYQQHGYGLSLVERKEDQRAIGMCGLVNRDGLEHPDLGFAFLPDFNGQGYAYEIASEVMEYATTHLHIPKVLAITAPDNTKSIRLLEKVGLKFSKTTLLPKSKEELLLFSN